MAGVQAYLIFVLFSPQTKFLTQFFSTPKRVNRDVTNFATKQHKWHKREILHKTALNATKYQNIGLLYGSILTGYLRGTNAFQIFYQIIALFAEVLYMFMNKRYKGLKKACVGPSLLALWALGPSTGPLGAGSQPWGLVKPQVSYSHRIPTFPIQHEVMQIRK